MCLPAGCAASAAAAAAAASACNATRCCRFSIWVDGRATPSPLSPSLAAPCSKQQRQQQRQTQRQHLTNFPWQPWRQQQQQQNIKKRKPVAVGNPGNVHALATIYNRLGLHTGNSLSFALSCLRNGMRCVCVCESVFVCVLLLFWGPHFALK